MRESEVQRRVKKDLEKKGYWVIKLIQCSVNGMPDLMALKDGEVKFVECKAKGKKPSPLQEYIHKKLTEAGFDIKVIDNV